MVGETFPYKPGAEPWPGEEPGPVTGSGEETTLEAPVFCSDSIFCCIARLVVENIGPQFIPSLISLMST